MGVDRSMGSSEQMGMLSAIFGMGMPSRMRRIQHICGFVTLWYATLARGSIIGLYISFSLHFGEYSFMFWVVASLMSPTHSSFPLSLWSSSLHGTSKPESNSSIHTAGPNNPPPTAKLSLHPTASRNASAPPASTPPNGGDGRVGISEWVNEWILPVLVFHL